MPIIPSEPNIGVKSGLFIGSRRAPLRLINQPKPLSINFVNPCQPSEENSNLKSALNDVKQKMWTPFDSTLSNITKSNGTIADSTGSSQYSFHPNTDLSKSPLRLESGKMNLQQKVNQLNNFSKSVENPLIKKFTRRPQLTSDVDPNPENLKEDGLILINTLPISNFRTSKLVDDNKEFTNNNFSALKMVDDLEKQKREKTPKKGILKPKTDFKIKEEKPGLLALSLSLFQSMEPSMKSPRDFTGGKKGVRVDEGQNKVKVIERYDFKACENQFKDGKAPEITTSDILKDEEEKMDQERNLKKKK